MCSCVVAPFHVASVTPPNTAWVPDALKLESVRSSEAVSAPVMSRCASLPTEAACVAPPPPPFDLASRRATMPPMTTTAMTTTIGHRRRWVTTSTSGAKARSRSSTSGLAEGSSSR